MWFMLTGHRPSEILLITVVLFVLIGAFIGSFFFIGYIDSHLGNIQTGTGIVVSKNFIPAHKETTAEYNVALDIPLPKEYDVDDEYRMTVRSHEQTDEITVSQQIYEQYVNGDTVTIAYSMGVLLETMIYIHEVLPIARKNNEN